MARKTVAATIVIGLSGLAIGSAGAAGDGRTRPEAGPAQSPIRFTESDVFVEINATDGDGGLHITLGGEAWTRLRMRDPRGRTVMDLRATGPLDGYGVADIIAESAEPGFDEEPLRRFRRRFPPGRYTFSGVTPEGRRLTGSDRLTHRFPEGPAVLAPAKDAVVDPASFAVTWRASDEPGIRVAGYDVVVTDEATEREFTVELGPEATSAPIPATFLRRGAAFAVEVVVRERSGNRTITEVPFTTAP